MLSILVLSSFVCVGVSVGTEELVDANELELEGEATGIEVTRSTGRSLPTGRWSFRSASQPLWNPTMIRNVSTAIPTTMTNCDRFLGFELGGFVI
jgi:hypothetical protein